MRHFRQWYNCVKEPVLCVWIIVVRFYQNNCETIITGKSHIPNFKEVINYSAANRLIGDTDVPYLPYSPDRSDLARGASG